MDLISVWVNRHELKANGELEKEFVESYIATRHPTHDLRPEKLHELFSMCDPDALFETRYFTVKGRTNTLYRGASKLDMRGLSWTTKIEVAENFARESREKGHDGQVYQVTADVYDIAFGNYEDGEAEYVLYPEFVKNAEIKEVN